MRSFAMRKVPQHESICIIEIGTGNVTGSIAYAGRIVFSFQKSMQELGDVGTETHIQALRRVHQEVLIKLVQEGLRELKKISGTKRISQVLMAYHAPWACVYTKHFHLEREVPFTLHKEKLEAFLKKAQEDRGAHPIDQEILGKLKMEIVEQVPASFLINGYQAEYRESKNVRTMSADYFFGVLPSDLLTFRDDVERSFGYNTIIRQHTHAFLFTSFVHQFFPKSKNTLLATISDEMTEIGVVKDGVLRETFTTDVGIQTLSRTLAKISKTVPQETKTYLKKDSGSPFSMHIKRNVASVGEEYRNGLEGILERIRESYVIPEHAFVISPFETEAYFEHILRKAHKCITASVIESIHGPENLFFPGIIKDPFTAMYATLINTQLTVSDQETW